MRASSHFTSKKCACITELIAYAPHDEDSRKHDADDRENEDGELALGRDVNHDKSRDSAAKAHYFQNPPLPSREGPPVETPVNGRTGGCTDRLKLPRVEREIIPIGAASQNYAYEHKFVTVSPFTRYPVRIG